jgi:hypothetical protein
MASLLALGAALAYAGVGPQQREAGPTPAARAEVPSGAVSAWWGASPGTHLLAGLG